MIAGDDLLLGEFGALFTPAPGMPVREDGRIAAGHGDSGDFVGAVDLHSNGAQVTAA